METNENTESVEEVTIEDPKAVLAALDRAKADAKKYREQAEKLELDLSGKNQLVSEYSSKLLTEKVVQMLGAEGVKDPKRILKYMDISGLKFDDEFNVVGFQDQFNSLKEELPEVFDAKLRVGGQADTAVKASVSTQYTATEMQAMKILGKI